MDYRSDQIKNYLTTHDSFKLKIKNVNSETKWLNLTIREVNAIENLLALIKSNEVKK